MFRVQVREGLVPCAREFLRAHRVRAGAAQLVENFLGRPVVEPQVGPRKTLIEQRNAQEMHEGLFFGRIAQIRAHVAAAGKHNAGYAPVIGLHEAQYAFGKDQTDGVTAQADLTHSVNLPGIDAQCSQRFIDFSWTLLCIGEIRSLRGTGGKACPHRQRSRKNCPEHCPHD